MKSKIILFLCILYSLCTAQVAKSDKESKIIEFSFRSTENGNKESINVRTGDKIKITLEENPTTGYEWMIPEAIEKYNVIWSLLSSEYERKPSRGMVGVGGKRTIILSVDRPGNEFLTFVYGRPWLYDNAMESFKKTGYFNAEIMQGDAVQLNIIAS